MLTCKFSILYIVCEIEYAKLGLYASNNHTFLCAEVNANFVMFALIVDTTTAVWRFTYYLTNVCICNSCSFLLIVKKCKATLYHV